MSKHQIKIAIENVANLVEYLEETTAMAKRTHKFLCQIDAPLPSDRGVLLRVPELDIVEDHEEWISLSQAAAIVQLSTDTVLRRCKAKEGLLRRFGSSGRWQVNRTLLIEMFQGPRREL